MLLYIYQNDLHEFTSTETISLLPHDTLETSINHHYADDPAYVCGDIDQVKRVLRALNKWCTENEMQLNIGPEKSALMPFLSWKKKEALEKNPVVKYDGVDIPLVMSYK